MNRLAKATQASLSIVSRDGAAIRCTANGTGFVAGRPMLGAAIYPMEKAPQAVAQEQRLLNTLTMCPEQARY